MDQIFAFFFKYRPFFFESGKLSFQSPLPIVVWLAILVGVPAVLYLLYRRRWFAQSGRLAWLLIGLRTSLFLVIAVMLSGPSLVMTSLVPKENLLAVLVDNSRSMGILDQQTREARGVEVSRLVAEDSDFLDSLDERFFVRRYRFSSTAERQENDFVLDWSGDLTNIGAGLQTVLTETRNLPLGGIVIFSDGADTSSRNFSEILSELEARKIPVHTVGIGPEQLENDIEIVQVSTPRVALPETMAVARLTVRQRGFGGNRARLLVREAGSLVESKEVYLPPDSELSTVEVSILPMTKGIKNYRFEIEPLDGEEIVENNHRISLIDVQDRRPRILYVEGHPRWEFKFIRQALADDEYIRLETLLRTALNKFYRQGIEEETTLATGFPVEREELFDYQGIIIGSVESSFFTYGQMEAIRDFVSRRGGGFLMLGGSTAFQSGKYRNTPIEEVLPVWLQEEGDEPLGSYYQQGDIGIQLTEFGANHPALQLSLSEDENKRQWDELPGLKDWNTIQSPKPGAVTLAQLQMPGTSSRGNGPPLLAFQRYGRGQALSLLTSSTWRWQMHQTIEDFSHETFWRQMMRWLVGTAKDPVTAETEREIYSRTEPVEIRAEVRDRSYNALNDARVEAVITTPSGEEIRRPLQWDSKEEGVYKGNWVSEEDGLHELRVEALERGEDGSSHGAGTSHFVVGRGVREYHDPVRKTEFLRQLAQQTGGNYYTLSDVDKLPEEIVYTESTSSRVEVLDLWDMPVVLLLLLALLSTEWTLRKKHGAI